jgi:anti-anti-sigma factor
MGDQLDNGVGHDSLHDWLTAANHAALGDMTSTTQTPWAAAVSVISQAGVQVVRVSGELATGSAAYLDLILEQEISAAPQALIVDLSDTAFIGARGLAALLRAAGRAAENSTTLCVAAPTYLDLLRRLRVLGVAEHFDVHRSVADCRWALDLYEPLPGRRKPPGGEADPCPQLVCAPSSEPSPSDASDLGNPVGSAVQVGLLQLAYELPGDSSSPRQARALIRSACTDWRIEALVSDATMVATELVTNAVEHARTAARLILRIDDTALHIAVRDRHVADDATLQHLRAVPAAGHGLQMVAAVSRVHGVTPHSDGKTVWAAIGLDPAE